jgi:hypothetical protein
LETVSLPCPGFRSKEKSHFAGSCEDGLVAEVWGTVEKRAFRYELLRTLG